MKYQVGYTTGVFDLFHVGHLKILEKAKEHCDHLIVGVTTDDEVRRVKGIDPFIPQDERMAIVKALKCVDQVVEETDVDKLQALEKLKFDVIFKGDDWKGSKLWIQYEQDFAQAGVDVMYFPYYTGITSSKIRKLLYSDTDD